MSVAIRDIKGAKIKDLDLMQMKFPEQGVAWNSAIKKQGEVRITLNREKLARIISASNSLEILLGKREEFLSDFDRRLLLDISDAIITNLKDLIEREE